jgi:hypothetical protein
MKLLKLLFVGCELPAYLARHAERVMRVGNAMLARRRCIAASGRSIAGRLVKLVFAGSLQGIRDPSARIHFL